MLLMHYDLCKQLQTGKFSRITRFAKGSKLSDLAKCVFAKFSINIISKISSNKLLKFCLKFRKGLDCWNLDISV